MQTISIITPTLNAEKYISETIESIIFQRGDFILENIVIDGNSTDQTVNICRYYQSLIQDLVDRKLIGERKIVIISEPDRGLYDGLSKGLSSANGEIIGYLNASDRYVPGALASVQQAFNLKPEVKWITGWSTFSSESGTISHPRYPFHYNRKLIQSYFYGLSHNHIQQESTFWRQELNSSIDLEKLSHLRYAGDYYLWYEFSKKNELWVVNALLGSFRKHGQQLSSDIVNYQSEALAIAHKRSTGLLTAMIYKICALLPVKVKCYLNRYSLNLK